MPPPAPQHNLWAESDGTSRLIVRGRSRSGSKAETCSTQDARQRGNEFAALEHLLGAPENETRRQRVAGCRGLAGCLLWGLHEGRQSAIGQFGRGIQPVRGRWSRRLGAVRSGSIEAGGRAVPLWRYHGVWRRRPGAADRLGSLQAIAGNPAKQIPSQKIMRRVKFLRDLGEATRGQRDGDENCRSNFALRVLEECLSAVAALA